MTFKVTFIFCVSIAIAIAEPPAPASKSEGYHYAAPKQTKQSKATEEYQAAIVYATAQEQSTKYQTPVKATKIQIPIPQEQAHQVVVPIYQSPQPQYHMPLYHTQPKYIPAQYSFEYGVNDPHTGDIKEQKETRNGDSVTGYYSLYEADGRKRIVHYTADKIHGFNAVVTYEGKPYHGQSSHGQSVPATKYLPVGPTGPEAPVVLKTLQPQPFTHSSSSSGAATSYVTRTASQEKYGQESHTVSTHITHIVPHHYH